MEYDLLVVGNGYDIGCGFKTTYLDFLDHLTEDDIQNSLVLFFVTARDKHYFVNEDWNGFEKLLCQYLQFINYCFENDKNVSWLFSGEAHDSNGFPQYTYFEWIIKSIDDLPKNLILILNLYNPLSGVLDISLNGRYTDVFYGLDDSRIIPAKNIYFRLRINASEANATKEYALAFIINELEKRLTDLENSLKKYIGKVTNKKTEGPEAFLNHGVKRIISFNYSDTAQRVYDISDDRVAYIHGKFTSSIVLGVEPSMIRNQSFSENSDFIKFFKRFRRFYKDCNKDYNSKVLDCLYVNSNVAIYGHSLDLSDKSILCPLFERKLGRYDIYCFDDVNNYKLKLAKLITLDLLTELENDSKLFFIPIIADSKKAEKQ